MNKEKETFENRIKKLETIVRGLEGDMNLEDAMASYKDGMKLIKICQDQLSSVEKKIMTLVEEKGTVQEQPIEEHEYPTLF